MERIRVASPFGVGLLTTAAFAALVAVAVAGRPVEASAEGPEAAAGHVESDDEVIRGIIAKYARSIDDADTALATEIWSKSPDISFIHSRGHERGWEEVKRNVYEKTMGAMLTDQKLTPRDVVVHVYGDAPWAEFDWDFAARFREDGQPLKAKGRETQVFRKADGLWQLVHVHYSGMPTTGKREGFSLALIGTRRGAALWLGVMFGPYATGRPYSALVHLSSHGKTFSKSPQDVILCRHQHSPASRGRYCSWVQPLRSPGLAAGTNRPREKVACPRGRTIHPMGGSFAPPITANGSMSPAGWA